MKIYINTCNRQSLNTKLMGTKQRANAIEKLAQDMNQVLKNVNNS